ncbi:MULTISPECIES: glycosyltransferase [unclassified Nostoc]|uniref:glycosyltransferase n=1 Tax=unclassified Nostoc TaxID=2593658 RepID=UPI000B9505C9|nr:glycosyltransferase [Nostoc sp. 'Peltigera membranacea cyanobiont' 232]OYE06314.1 glycosyl transferase family 1 [Nostoc sp. 'Peltigera membranacea cyanobiont' 232]
MKILHIIPSVASVRGGPSQAVLETVKALRNQGVAAEIVTTNDNGNNLLDVPLGKPIEYKQVPVQFFSRFSPKVTSIREFAFSSQLTTWLWQNAKKYDLLHIHAIFSYASTVAMAIARFQGIPYIVRPLGQLCEWSLQQSARRKQIYLNLIERSNLNHSQALHLTSEQEQQEVSRLALSPPSFVLPHGLSIPPAIPNVRSRLREHLQVPADEPIILFLSRLHPKKGLDYLIPALGKLTNYRFTFVIAGSGSKEYEAEIESLIVSNGMRDRTHFAGFVTGEEKNLFIQGSDIFALTSYAENFGIAVLEALAVGIPVVVTPGVALAAVVQQNKLGYVPELDVQAIAEAVDCYLSHPQAIKDMGDRARKLVLENYTWNHIAENLMEIYTKLIKQQLLSQTLI